MDDVDRTKYRMEALNLAYGILLNKYQAGLGKPPSLTQAPVPTTDLIVSEAEKLISFMKVP
jgi:hypothetical protein